MIATALLALAPLLPAAPPQAAPARSPQVQARARALRQLLNQGAGSGTPSLGGSFTTGAGPQVQVLASPVQGVWQVQLGDPGTGWQESVLVGLPAVPESAAAPLLVMFHGANVSEWDCYVNTPLFQQALDRGWYVIAPLGANQLNWGLPYAQQNIEYALTLFAGILPIDPTRIYGIGFSMGGGVALSYAALHQDLSKPRIAAIVNHTGSASIAHTYNNVQDPSTFENPLLFGGSPTDDPFLYSRSSVVDVAAGTLVVDPATDLARNLAHVPVLNQHADFDPLVYLIEQTQTVHAWLAQLPGATSFLLTPPFSEHAWTTIDEPTALNFLRTKTLQTPVFGQHRLLADREGSWLHFYVYQDAPGAFTPLRWDWDPVFGRLVLDQTANCARVVVNTQTLNLDTSLEVEVVMQSADGTGDVTTLTGYAAPPQEVLRDGQPTTSWSWDPAAETLTLTESGPAAGAVWRVRP
jgi:pimeloyl-ACP methyl ester carboxylesterase